ncbi:MAG: hypothetical protein LBS88_07400 [Tannerellaceae bacterium]|nr:hypothetical protein [Tannerellaceae bacterium]
MGEPCPVTKLSQIQWILSSLRGTKQSRVPLDCFTLPFAMTARNDDATI